MACLFWFVWLSLFFSPPSDCSSLPSTMTWAPCPHGVRTREKKETRPVGCGLRFCLLGCLCLFSPPSDCFSLPSMMTWAPCPHGVRTRGKKKCLVCCTSNSTPSPTACPLQFFLPALIIFQFRMLACMLVQRSCRAFPCPSPSSTTNPALAVATKSPYSHPRAISQN